MTQYIDQTLSILNKAYFWRLFVDGAKQKSTSCAKEAEVKYGYLMWVLREPHSLDMMRTSAKWLWSKDKIDEPLSYALIDNIQKLSYPARDNLHLTKKNTTNAQISFGDPSKIALETHSIMEKSCSLQKKLQLKQMPWTVTNDSSILTQLSPQDIDAVFPIIAKGYEDSLKTHQGDSDTILKIIVETAQTLELLHCFTDGNCRAIITLWLNKELMRAGLSPTILEDPNFFDWKSTDALIADVKHGQEAFSLLFAQGYPYTDCISNEGISDNIRELYGSHCEELSAPTHTKPFIDLLAHKLFFLPMQLASSENAHHTDFGTHNYMCEYLLKVINITVQKGTTNQSSIINLFTAVKQGFNFSDDAVRLCSVEKFEDFATANSVRIESMSPLQKLLYYRTFITELHDMIKQYTAENYFVDGKFPMMFLFAETCHLNRKEYIEYFSKKASEFIKTTEPLESMPLIAEEAVDLQTIS